MPLSPEARALLEKPLFASLATIGPDGHPQVTVIWLDVHGDGERVFFNTAAGRAKHRNMERDPRVTVLLLDPDNGYRYAELRGTVEMTEEGGEDGINALAHKYLGTDYPFARGETRVNVLMDVHAEHWMG
jgi:PPOX class probable F420-dependent enzyme